MCGTPNYIAPEVLRKEGHSPASEVWSLGCMIFALLTGSPPFETESVAATYSRIAAGTFSIPSSISEQAASFLTSLLVYQPEQRPNLASLLLHPFMLLPMPSSLPAYALTQAPPTSSSLPGITWRIKLKTSVSVIRLELLTAANNKSQRLTSTLIFSRTTTTDYWHS